MKAPFALLSTGIAPDRFTYNALLEVHAAGGDLDGASKLYDAMLARKVKPDICTFILLFQVCSATGMMS
jgi:pentatricopeptide repeat protein